MSDRLPTKKSRPGEEIYGSEVYGLASRIPSTLPFDPTPQSFVLSVQTQLDSQLVPGFPSVVNGTSESPPPPYSSCSPVAHFHLQHLSNSSPRETSALLPSSNSFVHRRLYCSRAASLSSFPALPNPCGSSPSSYRIHRSATQPLITPLSGNWFNVSTFTAVSSSTVQEVHVDLCGVNDGQSARAFGLTFNEPMEVDVEGLFTIYPHRELCRSPDLLEGLGMEEDERQYREQESHRCHSNWRDTAYWHGEPASPLGLKDGEVDDKSHVGEGIEDVHDSDPEHEGHPNPPTAIWAPISESVREQQEPLNVTRSSNPPTNQRTSQSQTSIGSLPSLSRYRITAEAQANDFDRILAELEWIDQEVQEIYTPPTHSVVSTMPCSPHASAVFPAPATVPTPIVVDGPATLIGQPSNCHSSCSANHSSSSSPSPSSSSYAQTSPMLPLRSSRSPVFAHLDSGTSILNGSSDNGVMDSDIIASGPPSRQTKVDTQRRMPFRRTIGGGGRVKAEGPGHANVNMSAMAGAEDTDDMPASVELTPSLPMDTCERALMDAGIAEAADIPLSAALTTELNSSLPDFYTTSTHNVGIASSPSISGNVSKFKFDPFAPTPQGTLDIVAGEQSHDLLPHANIMFPPGLSVLPSNIGRKQHSVKSGWRPFMGRRVSLNTYARQAQMRWMQEQRTAKGYGLEAPIYAREITQSPEPMELGPIQHSIIVEAPENPKLNALQSDLLDAERSLWGQQEGFRRIIQGLAGGPSIVDGHLDQQDRPWVANHQLTLTDSTPVVRADLPFVEERTKQHLTFCRQPQPPPSLVSGMDSDMCGEMKILAARRTIIPPKATFLGASSHAPTESSPSLTRVFFAEKPSTSKCVPAQTPKRTAHKHRNKLLAQSRFHRCVVDPVEDVLVACTPGFVPRWGFA